MGLGEGVVIFPGEGCCGDGVDVLVPFTNGVVLAGLGVAAAAAEGGTCCPCCCCCCCCSKRKEKKRCEYCQVIIKMSRSQNTYATLLYKLQMLLLYNIRCIIMLVMWLTSLMWLVERTKE